MLRFDGNLVKRLFWFGLFMTCAILDYFLEQRAFGAGSGSFWAWAWCWPSTWAWEGA
jgi:hypothetical protein